MTDDFRFDVFLSHSSKDKPVVRDIAERLKKDGMKVWFDEWVLKPGDSISAKIEEGLEHSRVLVLCMSANAFGSDWAQLESGTFRFRDPLNKERRFLPLRFDDTPIKGSLAQCYYIDWRSDERQQEYKELVEACRQQPESTPTSVNDRNLLPEGDQVVEAPFKSIQLDSRDIKTSAFAFSFDGRHVLSGTGDRIIRLWNLESGRCVRQYASHTGEIKSLVWSNDQGSALSAANDGSLLSWDIETGERKCIFTHSAGVQCVFWTPDHKRVLLGTSDSKVLLLNLEGRTRTVTSRENVSSFGRIPFEKTDVRKFEGHSGSVISVTMTPDESLIVSGASDRTIRIWSVESGRCLRVLEGHTGDVKSVDVSADQRLLVSGGYDQSIRVWNIETGRCLQVLLGHTGVVRCVRWAINQRYVISGASDKTLRLWDTQTGNCIWLFQGLSKSVRNMALSSDGQRLYAGGSNGGIRIWNAPAIATQRVQTTDIEQSATTDQVEYTNAKVLIVGDSNAGKTGLTHRLATGAWKPSGDSTVGAWATQVRLENTAAEPGVDKEIWLWDFGGQADQRLIHQLYMDRTALILLLFNADNEDVLPGLRDWQTALRRCVKEKIPHFLVAGRIDTGFKASRGKLQAFAKEQELAYYETSAKEGDGCDELHAGMIAGILWSQMEKRTSPRIFKLIKDEILKLRDEGLVLHTYKELRELLWRRLTDEPRFTDETLQTVIGLLDGPGVVKELDYGTYILLAPEWINSYAQAVIRTLRSAENDLGVLPLRSIAEGRLIYQSIGRDGTPSEMKRLPPVEERVVLGEMERQLEQRGLCLRQGDKLVFPSHCGRDRPAVQEHPSVFVSYSVKGFLDDIYATLTVKLADSESFHLKEIWRDAADFVTLADDHHMGIKLTRETASDGDISVYFGKGVTEQEQVIFANYIHAHLESTCEHAQRLRHYVCPNCHAQKGNAEVLMKKLLREKQNADTECDGCGMRFPLWDALEKKFASEVVRQQVQQLKADDLVKLDTRRRGKLLALEVGARITSADQKCFEIPATEDEGLDMELEFTNDDGEGTGQRLYLQLKSGNSYLTKRKTDGADIFTIKKQRWVEYWLQQPHPVMLVIGTFSDEDERMTSKEKLEFADVRWMEISSILKSESENGSKPVKQIEFKGERLDLSSVRKWRRKILTGVH